MPRCLREHLLIRFSSEQIRSGYRDLISDGRIAHIRNRTHRPALRPRAGICQPLRNGARDLSPGRPVMDWPRQLRQRHRSQKVDDPRQFLAVIDRRFNHGVELTRVGRRAYARMLIRGRRR